MIQGSGFFLRRRIVINNKWPLICVFVFLTLSYIFASLRALSFINPVATLFWLTPVFLCELFIASVGLTYGLSIIVNRHRDRSSPKDCRLKMAFTFALCFCVAFIFECTILQYNHYGIIWAGDSFSTRDTTEGWKTLRFGKFSMGDESFYKEDYYISLADTVDYNDVDDAERASFIEETLGTPSNSFDKDYQKQIDEYEKRDEDNGVGGVYPKLVTYDEEMAVVSFPNINTQIASIHITPFFLLDDNKITGDRTQHIDAMVVYSDEDNTNRKTDMFSIVKGQEYTEYIPLYPVGKVTDISICFCSRGASFTEISLNEVIPLTPVLLRMLLIASFLFLIWLLRRYDMFALAFNAKDRAQNIGFAMVMVLMLMYCAFLACTAVEFDYEPGSAGQYNHYLVDSLLHGKVDLDLPTSNEFAALSRPYDRGQFELYDIDYLGDKVHWDTVFYEGKWYSYFGIVPAVLLFVPYTAITGHYLPYSVACLIMGYLAIVFLAFIWRRFCKEYLRGVSYAVYLSSTVALAMSSFVPFLIHRSFFYESVNLGGLMFCSAGLLLLLKHREQQNYSTVAASCLCFALAVGCRPIMGLSSILVPLFLLPEAKQQWRCGKATFVKWISVIILPYVLVAIPLMWYNYARFGSVFDFGSTYQVTGLNLSVQSLINPVGKLQRILIGIESYFLNPPEFLVDFPFAMVQKVPVTGSVHVAQYLGAVGLLCVPIVWMLFFSIGARALWSERPLILKFTVTSFLIALFTAGISATYCIQPRYEIDYAWLIMLSALFSIPILFRRGEARGVSTSNINRFVFTICVASILLFFFLNFRGEIDPDTAIRPVAMEAYLRRSLSIFGGI